MKRIALSIMAAATVVTALPVAAAAQGYGPRPYSSQPQQWQSINQRQAELERRINWAVQRGQLTRREAQRIRSDFRVISQREADYRRSRPGLTLAERRDLDRRFDILSARIRYEARDNDRRGDGFRGDRDYNGGYRR